MNQAAMLQRIYDILHQQIAMGQGEGRRRRRTHHRGGDADSGALGQGRKRRVTRKRGGDCDSGALGQGYRCPKHRRGGVSAGRRMSRKMTHKKRGGVSAGVSAGRRMTHKKGGSRKKHHESDWMEHVRKYMNKHGCSYKEAMQESAASYKKNKH